MSDLTARLKALREAHEKLKPCGACSECGIASGPSLVWKTGRRVRKRVCSPACRDVFELRMTEGSLFADGDVDPPRRENPMVRLFGPGPAGTLCKTCVHLRRHRQANVWHKCDLRINTGGRATDHRSRWPACGKYEEG
jgi:hypothetical protein